MPTNTLSNIDLASLVPESMQTDFWKDFNDAWSDELMLFRTEKILPIIDKLNIRELEDTDTESLRNIMNMFGYTANSSLDSSGAFLKDEIKSISYRIKNKTTYSGYDYIFSTIPLTGYVYNLYYDGFSDTSLIKAINYNDHENLESMGTPDGSTSYFQYELELFSIYTHQTIDIYLNGTSLGVTASDADVEILASSYGSGTYNRTTGILIFVFNTPPQASDSIEVFYEVAKDDINTELLTYDFYSVFTKTLPQYNYSFVQDNQFTLDNVPLFYLDDDNFLDTDIFKQTTHHLAIEIIPESLIDNIYLTNATYLDYVDFYVKYNKKVTEIPHVGAQITLVTDDSRFYNNLNGYLAYTVPALKARLAVTQDYSVSTKDDMFKYIVAGTGSQTMWGHGETPGSLTALNNQVYYRELSANESDDTGNYFKVNSYVPVNQIRDYLLFTGDGVTYNYSGTTLYSDIVKKSFHVKYYANNVFYDLSDTIGTGIIEEDYFYGTIDYTTGSFDLNFVNDVVADTEIVVGGGNVSSITNAQLAHQNILFGNNFVLNYWVGNVEFNVSPDSSGVFAASAQNYITSGSITSTGLLNMVFTTTVDAVDITADYSYNYYSIPTSGFDVTISYNTNEAVHITEIGILDVNKKLVLYSQVPPLDCAERDNYHLGIQYYIQK
jgi:hypothetical protein